MNQPASFDSIDKSVPRKALIHLLRQRLLQRNPSDLLDDILCLLRAGWALRSAEQVGQRSWLTRRARLWGRLRVKNQGRLFIGNRVRINGNILPTELVTGPHGRLEIGNNVFINYGCSICALQYVRIGDSCSIGTYAIIIDNNFHRLEPERRNELPDSAPVILEENVWLGARVIVLPGVTIGRDSVIAAGSIVTNSIPPRSLAAGAPAHILRTL